MRYQQRVTHILTERLADAYARTLCGRIIRHLGPTFGMYPDTRYFEHHYPDCQDCLRLHFTGTHE